MRLIIFFMLAAIATSPSMIMAMPVSLSLQSNQSEASRSQGPVPVIELQGRRSSSTFNTVIALFAEKKYQDIITLAKEEIARTPSSGLAYEILGTALYLSDSVEEALLALQQSNRLEPQQSGALSKLGIIELQKDNILKAKEYLLKALKINASDRLAHQYLGLVYEAEKNTEKGIFHFQQGLIGTDPQYIGVALNLGRLLNLQNRYRETLTLLEPRVPMTSTFPEAHLLLGTAYLQIGNFSSAQERFERVLTLQPDMQEARLGIAIAMRKAGKIDEALKLVQQINEQKTNWLPAVMEQGELLLLKKDLERAKDLFSRGVQLGSNPIAVQKRLAQYYSQNNELQKAVIIYEELLSTGNADEIVYANLSEIYQVQNETDKGLRLLEQAVESHKNNPYLLFRLGSYFASTMNYQKAASTLIQAHRLAQSDPQILKALTLAQAKAGDKIGALKSAKLLYDLDQKNEVAVIVYATRLSAAGQSKEAENVYKQTLQKQPNLSLARNNLANILADKGDLTEAENIARPLMEKPGNENSTYLDTLGWILYRQKKYPEALSLLTSAQSTNTRNPLIQYHYGMALAATGSKEAAKKELENAIQHAGDADWVIKAQNKIKEL